MPSSRRQLASLASTFALAAGAAAARPAWAATASTSPTAAAAASPVPDGHAPIEAPSFEGVIGPLLARRCTACHGDNDKKKGGLDLRTVAAALRGGDEGPALVFGNADASLLWRRIEQGEMPPEDAPPLTATERSLIRAWIKTGAAAGSAGGGDAERPRDVVTDKDRAFWSFRPPVRPPLPPVSSRARVRTPIDAFVLAELEAKGLSPSPDADRRALLRRVSFDLTGLPPTPEEIAAFERDPSPTDQAYARLVDRLLASPHYGERWGRHWLDVAGYAESALYLGDMVRPGFWRYRDYVIRAFNSDKPFDQFVREQLAGDEMVSWRDLETLPPEIEEKLAATGFLRTAPDGTDNQAITQKDKRFIALQGAVEISMKALMGLTLNCVRCHSHKFDPIPHEDYYRLTAIFQPAYDPERWLAGNHFPGTEGPLRRVVNASAREQQAYDRRQKELGDELARLQKQRSEDMPRQFRERWLRERLAEIAGGEERLKLEAALAVASTSPARTPQMNRAIDDAARRLGMMDEEALKRRFPEMGAQLGALEREMSARTRAREDDELPWIWALWDASTAPSPTRVLRRGDFDSPGRVVGPGVLAVLDRPDDPFFVPARPPSPHTTGRRLALARWLTSPRHPLLGRVFVNRVWQFHFGRGIVATPDDFGARGARPTHPELLDWLAVELVERGYSVKALHRQILLSTAYRQSSRFDAGKAAVDPANKLLWRMSPRRLEAEAVRDAMLAASGDLDLSLHGRSVTVIRTEDKQYAPRPDDPGRHRRSVYLQYKRAEVPTFLAAFDAPAIETNAPIRSATVVPQQALAVMNSGFVHERSARLAARVLREAGGDAGARVRRAFLLTFGRTPRATELARARAFLGTTAAARPVAGEGVPRPWIDLCHALFSANESIYVD